MSRFPDIKVESNDSENVDFAIKIKSDDNETVDSKILKSKPNHNSIEVDDISCAVSKEKNIDIVSISKIKEGISITNEKEFSNTKSDNKSDKFKEIETVNFEIKTESNDKDNC